jgi:hypothetical protein
MVNVVTLNYENSLDHFICEEKKMLYIKWSRPKSLLDGWVDGWVDGWMAGKAGLRIAYSNQKVGFSSFKMLVFVSITIIPC